MNAGTPLKTPPVTSAFAVAREPDFAIVAETGEVVDLTRTIIAMNRDGEAGYVGSDGFVYTKN